MDASPHPWYLEPGLSILVGSVDARGVPSCCRGVAIAATNQSLVTIFVPLATSQRVIADAATTHRLSVSASDVISHRTIQFKGRTGAIRMALDEERAWIEQRLRAFAESIGSVGVPMRHALRLAHWPAFAVDLRVEETFDQTPGPNAGCPLS